MSASPALRTFIAIIFAVSKILRAVKGRDAVRASGNGLEQIASQNPTARQVRADLLVSAREQIQEVNALVRPPGEARGILTLIQQAMEQSKRPEIQSEAQLALGDYYWALFNAPLPPGAVPVPPVPAAWVSGWVPLPPLADGPAPPPPPPPPLLVFPVPPGVPPV